MFDLHQDLFLVLSLLLVLYLGVELVCSVDVEGQNELQDVVLVEALLFGLSEKRVYQKLHGDSLQ